MNRESKSVVTQKVDTATYGDFALTFNYSYEQGETKPRNVTVNGTKKVGETYVSLSGSATKESRNVSFQGADYNEAVATEVIKELVKILNETA